MAGARNRQSDRGAAAGAGLDPQGPTDQRRPFPHRDPAQRWPAGGAIGGQAAAVIDDREHPSIRVLVPAEGGRGDAGMLRHVPEGFLRHPVERQSGGTGRLAAGPVDPGRDLEIQLGAALGGELGEGRRDARLLEQGGMEAMGHRPKRGGEGAQLLLDGGSFNALAEPFETVADGGELLEGVVVDLAGDPGPLLVLRLEQSLAEPALQEEAVPLVDDQRRAEGDDGDRDREGRGQEERPEAGIGHKRAPARARVATVSTTDLIS